MPSKSSNATPVDSSKRRKGRGFTSFPEWEHAAAQHGEETSTRGEFEQEIAPVEAPDSLPTRSDWEQPVTSPSPTTYQANIASNISSGPAAQYQQQQAFHDYYSPPNLSPAPNQPDLAYRRYSSSHSTSPRSQQRGVPVSPYPSNTVSRFPIHPPPPISRSHYPISSPSTEALAGSKPYFNSLDSLDEAADPSSAGIENVVLSGFDDRLEVHAVGRKHLRPTGKLVDLNGAVLSAKILPSTSLLDSFPQQRPLVALIILGPPANPTSDGLGPEINSNRQDSLSDPQLTHLQTKVEIWSLKTGQFVTTLYKSPLVPTSYTQWPHTAAKSSVPQHLRLEVQSNFLVLASGQSGEVFVFTPSAAFTTSEQPFLCIAKFWTSIIKSTSDSRPSSSSHPDSGASGSEAQQTQAAIFSLSHRWLAIAPPSSQSRYSISGTVPISPDGFKPVGVETVTPSAPPTSNCTLDVPNPESLTNKVARGVAKEVLRGAQWMGAQGWQAWQNYWNPSSSTSASTSGPAHEQTLAGQFPPTHAESQGINAEVEDKGELISIIDLQQLLRNSSTSSRKRAEPVATFTLSQGCSFISFSPHGLLLMTVSHNGDTQHVWNLSKIRARKESSNVFQPSVAQVATFSRFSNTRVVDVVWTKPRSDRLAVVTSRGTIHLFKLPTSAFTWPLQRPVGLAQDRRGSSQEPSTSKAEAEISDTRLPMSQAGPLSTAASTLSSKARPIVTTVRQRSNSSVSTLTNNLANFNVSTAAGIQGGKYLVHGVSRSFGAAAGHINQMRRASTTKLAIKGGADSARPACVHFLTGKERGFLGALSSEHLTLHRVNAKPTSGSSAKDIELPLPTSTSTPARQQQSNSWLPARKSSDPDSSARTPSHSTDLANSIHPLASAELETCASFPPFYAARNITISTFKTDTPDHSRSARSPQHTGNTSTSTSPWIFGDKIDTEPVKLTLSAALFGDSEDPHEGTHVDAALSPRPRNPSDSKTPSGPRDTGDPPVKADARPDFVTEDDLQVMLEQPQLVETLEDEDLMLDVEDETF